MIIEGIWGKNLRCDYTDLGFSSQKSDGVTTANIKGSSQIYGNFTKKSNRTSFWIILRKKKVAFIWRLKTVVHA